MITKVTIKVIITRIKVILEILCPNKNRIISNIIKSLVKKVMPKPIFTDIGKYLEAEICLLR